MYWLEETDDFDEQYEFEMGSTTVYNINVHRNIACGFTVREQLQVVHNWNSILIVNTLFPLFSTNNIWMLSM